MSKTKGYIHSIETFGSVDGPGVRFVIFMQGCRFRCAFCHNPDTWKIIQKENFPSQNENQAPIKDSEDNENINNNFANLNSSEPTKKDDISVNVETYSPEDLLKKALRYKTYWGEEGGITVSGGEPLLQIDFLIEFFELCKKNNVSTCLDTAGGPYISEELVEKCNDEKQLNAYKAYLGIRDNTSKAANLKINNKQDNTIAFQSIDNTEEIKIKEKSNEWHGKFLRLMKSTDIVLLDIKQINNEKHKALVGFSNENILAMAKELDQLNVPAYIRHVLLPESNVSALNHTKNIATVLDTENIDTTSPSKNVDTASLTNKTETNSILEKISDDEKDLKDLRAFIDTLHNTKKVEVLPYHTLGVYKYESLRIDYRLKDIDPPTDERIALAKHILCS